MDKISDIYNNTKDRLSNPFLFSFMCSWLIYNWRIPIALIKYDKSQFSGCGCNTIFDFISHQYYATEGSIRFPFMFAILYSIATPIIKNLVRSYNTWSSKWGGNWNLNISEGSKIGIEKYLKLRENYKIKLKKLEEISNEESKYLNKNTELLNEINETKNKLNIVTEDFNNMKTSIGDVRFLDGEWKYINKSKSGRGINNEKSTIDFPKIIYISKGTLYSGPNKIEEFIVTNFNYNPINKTVLFIKKIINKESDKGYSYDKEHFINILKFTDNDINNLSGTENGDFVDYERINKL